jgi:hypothetical protein
VLWSVAGFPEHKLQSACDPGLRSISKNDNVWKDLLIRIIRSALKPGADFAEFQSLGLAGIRNTERERNATGLILSVSPAEVVRKCAPSLERFKRGGRHERTHAVSWLYIQ